MDVKMAVMAAAAASLLVAACGDDGDPSAETGDQDQAAGDSGDAAGSQGGDCLLDAAAVGEALGGEVTFDGFSVGGFGRGGGEMSVDAEGVESSVDSDGSYSVGWEGCTFTTDDGTEYLVGELVTQDGEPDVTGLEVLVGLAGSAGNGGSGDGGEAGSPDVGDEAFIDDDELVARVGDRTLVVGFSAGSNPTAEDMDILTGIAGSLADGGPGDIATACQAAADLVPEAWGPVGNPLTGGGGGVIDGTQYSYDSCSLSLLDGDAGLEVNLGDAQMYDLLAGLAEGPGDEDDDPELVDGLGDAAVRLDDRVFVQVGDRGVVVSGTEAEEDEEGEDVPADPATVEALAGAAADALTG